MNYWNWGGRELAMKGKMEGQGAMAKAEGTLAKAVDKVADEVKIVKEKTIGK